MILLPHVTYEPRLDYALRNYPKAAKFNDYREMFSHMGDKIDVLSISTQVVLMSRTQIAMAKEFIFLFRHLWHTHSGKL